MLSSLSTLLRSPPSSPTARKFSVAATTRTYEEAVDALNSLQTNAAVLEALRASGGKNSELAMPEMIEYLDRIGYQTVDLNRLNVIHVTGTKGKGSTCAFTDSILRKTVPEWKIGLYTSPHLVAVRERIRINGVPISEEDFTKYFFEVWDRLEANPVRKNPTTSLMPAYFRFMTLLAFHYFSSINVDATILEVGVGGFYDSTNVVPKPIVAGVTSLGLDHVNVLGNTLKDIAWQKGGIYKHGVPALTVDQPEEAMTMLRQQATTLKASSFTVVPSIPELSTLRLGLAGAHQVQNATLAVNLAHQFILSRKLSTDTEASVKSMPSLYPTPLPQSFVTGLESTRWPGRCQEVVDPNHSGITWFLDGAHTVESLTSGAEWFIHPAVGLRPSTTKPDSPSRKRVLIFNSTGGRSGAKFLGVLLDNMRLQLAKYGAPTELGERGFFDSVIFCTNVTYADGRSKGDLKNNTVDLDDQAKLKVQQELAQGWTTLLPAFPAEHVHTLPSVQHAVKVVHDLRKEGEVDVLVAGSLHLVGGVIEVADIGSVALAV